MALKLFAWILFATLLSPSLYGKVILSKGEKKMGLFSGRISKVNGGASLLRIKVGFSNMKYLNKKDKVEFWDEHDPRRICRGFVAGKSNDYLLLKIPDFNFCEKFLFLSPAVYLKFFSEDLANNVKMGRELISILLKKRLALGGKLGREQKELDSYIEKSNAVNDRYFLLREKLEKEWRQQLAAAEEDKATTLRNFKALQIRVDEVDFKLERYKIEDENLHLDRWALDPRLHFRK
jgi:hypothetical protein